MKRVKEKENGREKREGGKGLRRSRTDQIWDNIFHDSFLSFSFLPLLFSLDQKMQKLQQLIWCKKGETRLLSQKEKGEKEKSEG